MPKKINTLTGVADAVKAEGCAIVIDVWRAFTVEAVLFSRGLQSCLLTDSRDQAVAWKARGLGIHTLGEVAGLSHEETGFDYGNSPREALTMEVAGQQVIHRTSSGTSAICAAAPHVDSIYACSFLNAAATARAVLAEQPAVVTLIASGSRGLERHDEDELCAIYLRCLLEGTQPDREAVATFCRAVSRYKTFAKLVEPGSLDHDGEIALRIDSCDFAIKVTEEEIAPGEKALVARSNRAS